MHVTADPVSHLEQCAHSAKVALTDLADAIDQATTRRELIVLREMTEQITARAEQLWKRAMYRDETFDERTR